MLRLRARLVLIASSLATALVAQAGNEVVFVGSSTSGSTDLHAFAQTGPGALLYTAPSSHTDNVSDAVWADTGRVLYVAQTLQNRVSVGQWNGQQIAAWSTLYTAPGACFGVGHDPARKRLWTLVTSPTAAELHCVNADPASAGYGQGLAQTSTLSGPIRERWALAPSGNFAVVPYGVVNSGPFQIVDTDPASPTFLQVVVSAPIPTAQSLGFCFAFDCKVSLDEQYCYVLYAGAGFSGIAVYDRAAGAFVDFDAAAGGQQDFALAGIVGNSLALSPDRSFALVSTASASGRVVRVDFDYVAPGNSSATSFANLSIPHAQAVSLSPDGARGAVTSTAQQVAGPGKLVLFDAATGVELATVALGSMWNLYTTAWQDGSPNGTFATFGAGCSGSFGEPALAPAIGERPRIGQNFALVAGNLPLNLAVVAVGFSNVASGGLPLPLPLAAVGMGGCSLLVDPLVTATISGSGGSATFSLPIPNDPLLFGFPVYCQAFPLDPGANQLGISASHGGLLTIGL